MIESEGYPIFSIDEIHYQELSYPVVLLLGISSDLFILMLSSRDIAEFGFSDLLLG
ncbi:hypothetical protein ACFL4K_00250 [Candidatus Neomarinimicrobiota bacterium]